MPWEWAAHCHGLSVPQPACSVIYHFLQLTKRCQFSWTVCVGWYTNTIHLTHRCIILPFVQCRCDLSRMLCGNFPVTLIVAAWEQLPTVGNSWKGKQVQVWARSDPAGCETVKKPFWEVHPSRRISHWISVTWNRLQLNLYQLGCLKALKILHTEKAEGQQDGVLVWCCKSTRSDCAAPSTHIHLSGLYPVEGGVGCWPGDGIFS